MRKSLLALFVLGALATSVSAGEPTKVVKKSKTSGTYLLTNRGGDGTVFRVVDTRSGQPRVGILAPARTLAKAKPDSVFYVKCEDGTEVIGYGYAPKDKEVKK